MLVRKNRWPLKIFIRSFHTLLCILIPISLLTTETSELHAAIYKDDNYLYPAFYFSILLLSLIMYHVTCWIDPGYVRVDRRSRSQSSSDEEGDIGLEESIEDTDKLLKNRNEILKKKCGFCDIVQPIRAKHCNDCGRCVRRFDHHCPWLETCIAERTHKYFLVFLSLLSVTVVWSVLISWRALKYQSEWMDWLRENCFLVLDLFVLVVGGSSVIMLCLFHSHLMCVNSTTWEVVSREKITYLKNLDIEFNPFHEGYCKNAFVFLCSRAPRNWDKVYFRRASDNNAKPV